MSGRAQQPSDQSAGFMRIISGLLMLAPAGMFVCVLLIVLRFNSLGKYIRTVVIGMVVAFALMFIGIFMRLNL